MKKICLVLFVLLSLVTISERKVSILGWYYYNGKDTSVIEHTEPEVYYVGKDTNGYYVVNYKNEKLKEKNKRNLKICRVDSRKHVTKSFRYFSASELKANEYNRKLTKDELINVIENLQTAKQSKKLCGIG